MAKLTKKQKEDLELKNHITIQDRTINIILLILSIFFSLSGLYFILTNKVEVGQTNLLPRSRGMRTVVINGPFLLLLAVGCFYGYFSSSKNILKKKKNLENTK